MLPRAGALYSFRIGVSKIRITGWMWSMEPYDLDHGSQAEPACHTWFCAGPSHVLHSVQGCHHRPVEMSPSVLHAALTWSGAYAACSACAGPALQAGFEADLNQAHKLVLCIGRWSYTPHSLAAGPTLRTPTDWSYTPHSANGAG